MEKRLVFNHVYLKNTLDLYIGYKISHFKDENDWFFFFCLRCCMPFSQWAALAYYLVCGSSEFLDAWSFWFVCSCMLHWFVLLFIVSMFSLDCTVLFFLLERLVNLSKAAQWRILVVWFSSYWQGFMLIFSLEHHSLHFYSVKSVFL